MIIALKSLFKDSVVYTIANIIQKLAPLIVIPIVIKYLGNEALKIYDLSFVYVYLFSALVFLGLDSAASAFYFDQKKKNFNKKQVLGYGFYFQLISCILYFLLIYPYRQELAVLIFPNDPTMEKFWVMALSIIPGYIMLSYGLNIALWQKRKALYVITCFIQTILTVAGVYAAVVIFKGTISDVFYVLIGSMSITGFFIILYLRKEVFVNPFPFNSALVKALFLFGIPFALTSFFRQLIPSIDRYFLLLNNYHQDLPEYILSVKLASFINIGFTAFLLAFTPYSLNKINDEDAEQEISAIFRLVAVITLSFVPLILAFKDPIVAFFANDSYVLTPKLLPIFLFGWVFDLFTNFAFLGVYKSHNSLFILALLITGTVIIIISNILLIPVFGVFGAAISFFITKCCSFFVAFHYLKKHFKIHISIFKLMILFCMAALCSYLLFAVNFYWFLLCLVSFLSFVGIYVYRTLQHYQLFTFSIKK
ncbi:MAG: polysaccharide biosynthesis C-terminal domain-containing protein [Flavisolibacter sp.]|nr:polysaccharide biosynthesis C-terminal domain-containing protein [Flavisolibacter sp.]